MSPTSYQTAPPRVREAHLIEPGRGGQASARRRRQDRLVGRLAVPRQASRGVEEHEVLGADQVQLFAGRLLRREVVAPGGLDRGGELFILAAAFGDPTVELLNLGARW